MKIIWEILWEVIDKKALREAFKEFLRVIFSDLVPMTIMVLGLIYLGFNPETGVAIKWTIIKVAIYGSFVKLLIQALTRASDRYIHVNPDIESKGFLPK